MKITTEKIATGIIYSYIGLSSETKPIVNVPVNSTYEETNTGAIYTYSGTVWAATKLAGTATTSAATGTVTVPMDTAVRTVTPTGSLTLNASGGTIGSQCFIYITTSGTTAYTITFGTNFKSQGTLDTGVVSGKIFVLEFVCVSTGTIWVEVSRTIAI